MGDDGSGNGLTFDAGFEADYWIGITGGGAPYALYANWAQLATFGGGPRLLLAARPALHRMGFSPEATTPLVSVSLLTTATQAV
jgi:hypothetical protein